MEDLVTDLLSTSIDVSGWMPDWVCQVGVAKCTCMAKTGVVPCVVTSY